MYCNISVEAQTVTNEVTAELRLRGIAKKYGGFIFDVKVTNNTDFPIRLYYTGTDENLVLTDNKGGRWETVLPVRSIGSPYKILEHQTFSDAFEVTTLGVTDTVIDNYRFGPVFEAGEYTATFPLYYQYANSYNPAIRLEVATRFAVLPATKDEIDAVDRFRVLVAAVELRFNGIPEQDSERLKDEYWELRSHIEICKGMAVHRRFMQSVLTVVMKNHEQQPEERRRLLHEYILMYPDAPYVRRAVNELQNIGVGEAFQDEINSIHPESLAVRLLNNTASVGFNNIQRR